jgi:hypothetical protein
VRFRDITITPAPPGVDLRHATTPLLGEATNPIDAAIAATPARLETDRRNSSAPRTPSHLLPSKPSAMLAARMVSTRANGPLTGTLGPIFDTAGDSSRCGCRGVHPIGWRRSTARPALYGIAHKTEICSPLLIAIYLASPNTLDATTIETGQFN